MRMVVYLCLSNRYGMNVLCAGRIPTGSLFNYICVVLKYLKDLESETIIVLSSIFPRLKWCYSDIAPTMEEARSRIYRVSYSL